MKLPALPRELADFGVRSLRRFVDIEGAQQATVLAAQAFTSLIPFLVVAAAPGPGDGDLGDRIVDRFSLEGSAARSVQALFNDTGEVESAVTWVGIVILVLSALSFKRAMQRMFQRAYGFEPGGVREPWRRARGVASRHGIAFSMQSWLLVIGFVAVVGAVASELYVDRIDRVARRRHRERAA